MKVTVNEKVTKKDLTFPKIKLMRNKENGKIAIVYKGVSDYFDSTYYFYYLGDSMAIQNSSYGICSFEDFPGSVTLEND